MSLFYSHPVDLLLWCVAALCHRCLYKFLPYMFGVRGAGTLVISIETDIIYVYVFTHSDLARGIFLVADTHVLGSIYSDEKFETSD